MKWTPERTRWHAMTALERQSKLDELEKFLTGLESAYQGQSLFSFRCCGALRELVSWMKSGERGGAAKEAVPSEVRMPYKD